MHNQVKMTSHEFAAKLLNTARLLFMKQDVELPNANEKHITFEFYDRESFLNSVRTLGSGKKEFGGYYFEFQPDDTILRLQVPRNAVCKKIQEEKWSCEPLLTPEEFTVTRE